MSNHKGDRGLNTSRLRLVRFAQDKGLRELARKAGVDHATLSRVERGLERPSLDLLLKVGRELGLRDLVRQIELWTE
jgi:transcriptional regulator with XRE-family HTH domain